MTNPFDEEADQAAAEMDAELEGKFQECSSEDADKILKALPSQEDVQKVRDLVTAIQGETDKNERLRKARTIMAGTSVAAISLAKKFFLGPLG